MAAGASAAWATASAAPSSACPVSAAFPVGSVADRRFAVLVAFLLTGCAEDDLEGALAQGACGPSGECAAGYHCNAQDQCEALSDAGPDSACGACAPGWVCCGASCVDKKSDPNHCGGCGVVCPGTACQGATCTNQCQAGLANCDNNALNGCEAPASSCPPDAG